MGLQVPERVIFEQDESIRTDLIEKVDSSKGLVARVPVDLSEILLSRRVRMLVSANGEVFGYMVEDNTPMGRFAHCYSQKSVDSAVDSNMLIGLGADFGLTLRDRIFEAIETMPSRISFFQGSNVGKVVYTLLRVSYGDGVYRKSVLRIHPFVRADVGRQGRSALSSVVEHLSSAGFDPVEKNSVGPSFLLSVVYEEKLDEGVFIRDRLPVVECGKDYKPVERVSLFG